MRTFSQSQLLSCDLAVSTSWGSFLVSVRAMGAVLCGVYIRAPCFLQTPMRWVRIRQASMLEFKRLAGPVLESLCEGSISGAPDFWKRPCVSTVTKVCGLTCPRASSR